MTHLLGSSEVTALESLTLEDSDPILPTKLAGKSASSFTASSGTEFTGVGFNSLICAFDPTDTAEDDRRFKPSELLTPSQACLQSFTARSWSSTLRKIVTVNIDMSKVSETKDGTLGRSVQAAHLDRLKPFFDGLFVTTTTVKRTLCDLHCEDGMASEDSCCDGYWIDADGHARGLSEAKSSKDAPVEATRQGISSATNIAIAQVKLGVPAEDVVVPIYSTTGHLAQFSAVILLLPCFPMVINLSKVLDLTDDSDRLLAAGYLLRIKTLVGTPLLATHRAMPEVSILGLSLRKYHVKSIEDFFCSLGDVHSSALNFLHVLGRLHRNEWSRKFSLFPYCFRQYRKDYDIVFPRLDGFRIGLPADDTLKEIYLITRKFRH